MPTRNKKGRFVKGSGGGRKRKPGGAKKRASAKRSHGLEARVTKLEKNQKVIVGVLHSHQKALVGGGLLSARAKKSLPQLGGGR